MIVKGVRDLPFQTGVPLCMELEQHASWYVIHTYAGYENKVKTNLEKRVESMVMEDKIFQVLVPVEQHMEIKNGKRIIKEKKIFPGYVLVHMLWTMTHGMSSATPQGLLVLLVQAPSLHP